LQAGRDLIFRAEAPYVPGTFDIGPVE
jgi:hypothetical protein